jgi:hypothetical protein
MDMNRIIGWLFGEFAMKLIVIVVGIWIGYEVGSYVYDTFTKVQHAFQ